MKPKLEKDKFDNRLYYLELKKDTILYTQVINQTAPMILFDYNKKDQIVGIEIIL